MAKKNLASSDTLDRKESLLFELDLPNLQGVEIGPLDKPIVLRNESNIQYADHTDVKSLRKKYSSDKSVNVDMIPDIDIVLSRKMLVDYLGQGSVDYVVASHVIEHAPDFVRFIEDAYNVLRVGGVLCLAIPDHRYTFDVFRRPTFFEDVAVAYDTRATRPSLDQILDHAKNVVEFDLGLAWQDYRHALQLARLKHPRSNIPHLMEKYKTGEYLDAHCWIFTPWSFLELTKKVCEQYKLPMSLRRFIPTQPMKNEFFVQLEKSSSFQEWESRWSKDVLNSKKVELIYNRDEERPLNSLHKFDRIMRFQLRRMRETVRMFSLILQRKQSQIRNQKATIYSRVKTSLIKNEKISHSRYSDFGKVAYRLCRGKGLEIGALHKPFDLDACVFYADRLSTSKLREAYKGDPRADHIQQIQVVSSDNRYDFFDDNSLDFVISSHVLEHTPNPGATLEEWNRIVQPGGIVYFVIPDKRFTLDKNRNLTDVSVLLQKYHEHVTSASYEEYCDALVNAEGGENTPAEHVKKAFEAQDSIHVHTFTADSTKEFVQMLAPVIGFEVVHFELQGIHIHVVLKKQGKNAVT